MSPKASRRLKVPLNLSAESVWNVNKMAMNWWRPVTARVAFSISMRNVLRSGSRRSALTLKSRLRFMAKLESSANYAKKSITMNTQPPTNVLPPNPSAKQ